VVEVRWREVRGDPDGWVPPGSEREGGVGMDWAGSVGLIGPIRRFWADLGLAGKKGKRRGAVGWVRKDGKERRFVCFVFFNTNTI